MLGRSHTFGLRGLLCLREQERDGEREYELSTASCELVFEW